MENVTDLLAYHINRNNGYAQTPFTLNQTIFIGNTKNPFFSFYDSFANTIYNPQDNRYYSIIFMARKVNEYLETGKIPSGFESLKDVCFDPKNMINSLINSNEHYIRYAREVLFEEVRKEFFNQLPSRQKCLWVIPQDEGQKSLNYWNGLLKNKESRILSVRLTGKIHRTNQDYLTLTTNSFNYIREQAFRYWNGTSGNETERDELLFEGFVTFIEEIKV